MLAMITDTSDQVGDVSQWIDWPPTALIIVLMTPDSLLSIQAQVDADTISGNSHGTRNSARNVAERRKCCAKNTASASPMPNWKTIETNVNTNVCSSAGRKVGS